MSWVWLYGYSLTTYGDDIRQHYNVLLYFHDYFRSILKSIFLEHSLNVPLYDFSIGYGADIITTMSWEGICDPLNLLTIFVPKSKMEYMFWIFIAVRLYLTGITFSMFSFSHGNGLLATYMGTMTYLFCGFVMNAGFHQLTFLNAVLYLPLVLLGADKVFQKRDGRLFSASVALLCISNFYWLYITVLLLILYCILYYLSNCIFSVKGAAKEVSFFLFYGAIGIMMGAFVLFPVAILLSESSRIHADVAIPLFYDYKYYIELFLNYSRNSI